MSATQPSSSHWGATLSIALLGLLALWGAVAGIALWTGRLEPHDPSADDTPAPSSEPVVSERAAATRPLPPPPAATHGAAAPAEAQRLVVCGREEAAPRLFELPNALWAVACGTSVHVVAFEAERNVLIARRIAKLMLPTPAPDRAPRAAPMLALDTQRDASWLVTTLRADRNGSPVSGAIFRVPLAAGDLLGTALRLHDAAPHQLVRAAFDKQPGDDFALLHLGDARLAQPSEVWLWSGGPAPLRVARKAVAVGATQLAALDLNADGTDEAVALAPSDGQLSVLAASDAQAPIALRAPGSEALHAIAIGGARTLVLAGKEAHVLKASADAAAPYALARLPALDGLRDLASLDVDADGQEEITGYAHPELVSVKLERASSEGAERSARFALRGEGYAVHQARLTHLDGDGNVDALALVTAEGSDPQVELLVSSTQAAAPQVGTRTVRWPIGATALRNAPLLREIELR